MPEAFVFLLIEVKKFTKDIKIPTKITKFNNIFSLIYLGQMQNIYHHLDNL